MTNDVLFQRNRDNMTKEVIKSGTKIVHIGRKYWK